MCRCANWDNYCVGSYLIWLKGGRHFAANLPPSGHRIESNGGESFFRGGGYGIFLNCKKSESQDSRKGFGEKFFLAIKIVASQKAGLRCWQKASEKVWDANP
jgi:hypothetical protein